MSPSDDAEVPLMNSRNVRLGLVAAAVAVAVLIGVILLSRGDTGARLTPSQASASGTGTQAGSAPDILRLLSQGAPG